MAGSRWDYLKVCDYIVIWSTLKDSNYLCPYSWETRTIQVSSYLRRTRGNGGEEGGGEIKVHSLWEHEDSNYFMAFRHANWLPVWWRHQPKNGSKRPKLVFHVPMFVAGELFVYETVLWKLWRFRSEWWRHQPKICSRKDPSLYHMY